eukprot:m.109813 g.109813  ORF g.109813 m.109813 type:complete len:267 (+) comp15999_c1_seq1:77-877(+)
MHSRAVLLLQRESRRVNSVPGVKARPVCAEANMFEWEARLAGPAGTVWEGAVFWLDLVFPPTYDAEPPRVSFRTIPLHPNIDPKTGVPCLPLLEPTGWQPDTTLAHLLLSLGVLLAEPCVDVPAVANPDAARLFCEDPCGYAAGAAECVVATQRVMQGLTPHEGVNPNPDPFSAALRHVPVDTLPERPGATPLVASAVSFDSYLASWGSIATTRAPKLPSSASRSNTLRPAHRPPVGAANAEPDEEEDLLSWACGLSEHALDADGI